MLDLHLFYIGLPLLAAVTFAVLVYLTWPRRDAPGANAFICLGIALIVWSVSGALETASGDLASALFWSKFKYFGVVLVPPLWLVVTLQLTGHEDWLTRRNVALLAIHPILALVLLWTTESHGLFWKSYAMDISGPFPLFKANRALGAWLHAAYCYALIFLGIVLLIRQSWFSVRLYRTQFAVIVVSTLVPWIANMLSLAGLTPFPGLDLTPIAFAFSAVGVAYARLQYKFLDIVPVARDVVIESMRDGVFVLDEENRIVDLNPAMRPFVSANHQEVLGKPVNLVFADYPALFADYGVHIESNVEVTVQRNGTAQHLDLRTTPLKTRQGRMVGRLVVCRDVTGRKRAEQETEKNFQQLAMLRRVDLDLSRKLDVNYVLAIALDFALRSTDADAGFIGMVEQSDVVRVAHLVGYYPGITVETHLPPDTGVVGRVVRQRQPELITDVFSDPDYLPTVEGTHAQICMPLISQERLVGVLNLETERPGHFTQEMFEFLKLITQRIANAIDNALLYQVSQQQLSELQELYGKVSRLEQLKTDMINIAAHDLRNPIGIIMNYASMLREEIEPTLDEQQRSFMDGIEASSSRILRITNDILSLERIEQSAKTLQPVELCSLVVDVFNTYKDQARAKSLVYELSHPPDSAPVISGDTAQLREAMSNLVSNAIKYTPVEGRIDVRLAQNAHKVTFEVKDTGYGIPADQQDQLFRPFFRAATDETQSIEGIGLGLHLVKNIVERYHGNMIFHSVYGEGSTFGFEFLLRSTS